MTLTIAAETETSPVEPESEPAQRARLSLAISQLAERLERLEARRTAAAQNLRETGRPDAVVTIESAIATAKDELAALSAELAAIERARAEREEEARRAEEARWEAERPGLEAEREELLARRERELAAVEAALEGFISATKAVIDVDFELDAVAGRLRDRHRHVRPMIESRLARRLSNELGVKELEPPTGTLGLAPLVPPAPPQIATCTICQHDRRDAIEAALAEGRSLRNVADEFGVSRSSLSRHRQHA